MRYFRYVSFLLVLLSAPFLRAQEVHSAPGQFDFYLLNLSWAPEFCHNVEVLPQNEHTAARRDDAAQECGTPRGFVLHGLWPQNTNGTWPANCSNRPGPTNYQQYLDMTPSVTLLTHEWTKHGTCTTLQPDAFFQTARRAYTALKIPASLQHVDHMLNLRPDDILGQFYQANPGYPQGSILLSCGRNFLTAIEACLDRNTLKPVACQNLKSCGANTVKVAPESTSQK